VRVRPITVWPGELSKTRRSSPFGSPWPTTLRELTRELRALSAHNVVLQIAMSERDFRVDGYPRADRRAQHPGVILSFDSRYGPLSYPCDTFTDWKDNLRAITLAMESLRRVDRYGVTKRGEQYAGWRQLPAGSNGSSSFATADEALRWMRDTAHSYGVYQGREPRDLYRVLAKHLHPDRGGSRADWDRLDAAKRLLEAGDLL
jgi:hypothetical protein